MTPISNGCLRKKPTHFATSMMCPFWSVFFEVIFRRWSAIRYRHKRRGGMARKSNKRNGLLHLHPRYGTDPQ
jgi:hypothetical protein